MILNKCLFYVVYSTLKKISFILLFAQIPLNIIIQNAQCVVIAQTPFALCSCGLMSFSPSTLRCLLQSHSAPSTFVYSARSPFRKGLSSGRADGGDFRRKYNRHFLIVIHNKPHSETLGYFPFNSQLKNEPLYKPCRK